ncbi:ABC transporter ATP-binding protein [Pseudotabrizicola alkalilacus]|uniref:ABC transporter ATP-binding protein n=1 Tax=Pseudotabrizicola alkalilacus TaxID=2305252 RepID=A0A411Z0A7_9RHOB|nr:ABC transporter ATP-binding protein [Pseudotabrizicola alkalilacus]RGP36484.1 ABC transporter ATP-binding protein [Pseudotabrizicola alkalilacus]
MNHVLEIAGLTKTFGGLTATDNVSLTVNAGEIHALIGPNGAGKSTLINQICGELMPNAGHIHLAGRDITRLPPAERVALGLGRTFQITSLLDDMTVRENLALAVQAREGGNFRIFDRAANRAEVWDEVAEILAASALGPRAGVTVADLAHGEKKQLELLMALSQRPRLLLLDEPMAGLGHLESQQMIDALLAARGDCAMLLVEHDMDAVFALADRVTVLVYGRVIAAGNADEIRANPAVRDAYLGEEDT